VPLGGHRGQRIRDGLQAAFLLVSKDMHTSYRHEYVKMTLKIQVWAEIR
jgi:hypothetical protein